MIDEGDSVSWQMALDQINTILVENTWFFHRHGWERENIHYFKGSKNFNYNKLHKTYYFLFSPFMSNYLKVVQVFFSPAVYSARL